MRRIRKIICIALMFCFIGSYVYGDAYEPMSEEDLIKNLEETYGIRILIPENEDYDTYMDCLFILDRGLKRFPQGVIKEVTEYYTKNGIATNVNLGKAEKIGDLFTEYKLNEKTAEIYIYTLQSELYNDSCTASEFAFIHEIGQYLSDYIFKVYGYEKIKSEFEKLNDRYVYGNWKEGYEKAFVNKHSAISFKDDVADLIWHAEVNPEVIRNINNGNHIIIHSKIEHLSTVIDQVFSSITNESRLWEEAVPQKPDEWALDDIKAMKEADLLPEEFNGLYNSFISKEDFYTLALNVIESKLGKDDFIRSFDLTKEDSYVTIDPVKGEICVDNASNKKVYNDKQHRLHEAYEIGLIDEGWISGSMEYITRLEIARLFNYIGNELGMDISDYKVADFEDISKVSNTDKQFIYFVTSRGLLKGDGTSFKPYDYCTYQEAYIIFMRLYELM